MHRVFPSSYRNTVSSRRIQLHWDKTGDSGEVVTPFVRARTYLARNFATLGPLWLRPPFIGAYIQCSSIIYSPSNTGQVSDPIRNLAILQSLVFLVNSRYPLLCATYFTRHSFSQSYRVNLPSSFSFVISYTLVFSTSSLVSDWYGKPQQNFQKLYINGRQSN